MGKHEAGSLKDLAKRQKAKGLQKVRWWCEMCQKQCRDANGFKQHLTSETHMRQMQLFSDNPGKFLNQFSKDFDSVFMQLLRLRGKDRVKANAVYQEIVSDKGHTHLNATKWKSLTQYVMEKHEQGALVAEDTPKGLYITYNDQDPSTVARRQAAAKKERIEAADAARAQREIDARVEMLRRQAEAAGGGEGEGEEHVNREWKGEQKVELKVAPVGGAGDAAGGKRKLGAAFNFAAADDDDDDDDGAAAAAAASSSSSSSSSAMASIASGFIGKYKEQEQQVDKWLAPGIVVKCMNKALADGAFYKKKGTVRRVIDGYIGEVEMKGTKHVIQLDQDDLQTVVPAAGGAVLVVNGPHRGRRATLVSIDVDRFCARLRLEGAAVAEADVPYEHFSKIKTQP